MKYYHIERVPVTVKALSPVFIGGGTEGNITGKTSVYLPQKNLWLMPDLNKLTRLLNRLELLDAFENFLAGPVQNKLIDFLNQHDIEVTPDAPWVAYTVECTDTGRINSVKMFIKDNDGLPYIPGSSVKGALRTAMLSGRVKDNRLLDNLQMNQRVRFPGEQENTLRTLTLNPRRQADAVNDIFRGLAISDSAPLDHNSLVICRKIDIGNSNTTGKMPLLRECLRPGTEARLTISMDTRFFPHSAYEELKQALNKRDELLMKRYYSSYPESREFPQPTDSAYPITLGAGVGFQSKTLIYSCPDAALAKGTGHLVLANNFRTTYKKRPDSPLPAPYCLKLTEYHGRDYPFGRCSIAFEE